VIRLSALGSRQVALAAGKGPLEHAAGAWGHAKPLGGGPGGDLGAGTCRPVAQQPQVVGVEGGGQRDDVQPLGERAAVVQVLAQLVEPLAVALLGVAGDAVDGVQRLLLGALVGEGQPHHRLELQLRRGGLGPEPCRQRPPAGGPRTHPREAA
jgi:hypothetical protein